MMPSSLLKVIGNSEHLRKKEKEKRKKKNQNICELTKYAAKKQGKQEEHKFVCTSGCLSDTLTAKF